MTTNIATTTTYFVGNHYEVANGVVTKYYYAGAQRIAMRTNGTLIYLLGDHLGSTSLVTDATGHNSIETRYKGWGEVRYSSGNMPTKYQYTGQYSYASDFGLMFYNARWYDSYLNHFTQPDSIVPDPSNPQSLNRYSYALNNPVRYTDPSGHCVLLEEDADGLCVHISNNSGNSTVQVVHGGSVFPNEVEVAVANYMLTGNSNWLNAIPDDTSALALQYSVVTVAANLGYETGYGGMDPTIILMALAVDPNGLNNDDDGYAFTSNRGLNDNISQTLKRIDGGGPFRFREDGEIFKNREGLLPSKPVGYYQAYTVITPGASNRGTVRIVTGQNGEAYLTLDHYETFTRIR